MYVNISMILSMTVVVARLAAEARGVRAEQARPAAAKCVSAAAYNVATIK